MDLHILILFVVTETVLCLTPGPAVLLTMSQSVRHGWKRALFGALGIILGNTVYFALSAAGVAAIVTAFEPVFVLVKIAGVLYLVWTGIRMWHSSTKVGTDGPSHNDSGNFQLLVHGLVLQLSNPKAIVFFAALLPQFVDPHGDVILQCLVLGATSITIEWPILAAYAWLADKGSTVVPAGIARPTRQRFAGATLILVGLLMGVAS